MSNLESDPSEVPTTKREAIVDRVLDQFHAELQAAGETPMTLFVSARFPTEDERGHDVSSGYRIDEEQHDGLSTAAILVDFLERCLRAIRRAL